ncbi:MAG: tyrosine-protein phosphatase [Tepidisphaeraceae bacterium]
MKTLGPIILIALILAAAGWWIFWTFFDTYHLATVKDGVLYRDGVRTLHEFNLAARKTHVKTVVSLVDDQEITQPPFTDELAYCKEHGIEVVRLPVPLGGWPRGEQIARFLAIADDPARQPVLVHCAQGVRRTGMMVAAYELSVLKLDKDQAVAAIKGFGHSDRTIGDVKRFIEVYDPQTQQMTADMPHSQE